MTPTPLPLNGAPELLPCPFCGDSDIFIEPDEKGSGGQWVSPIHVGCTKCQAEQCADEEIDAIAAWNRRTMQQAAGAIPEGWRLVPVQPDSNMMNSAPDAWFSWKSRDNGGNIQQLGILMWERYLAASPTVQPDSGHFGAGGRQDHLAACAGDRVQVCRADGRCQYAIDHGAEGMGHCPTGKCAMPAITEWQPIETAPMDGSKFLGYRDGRLGVACRVQRDDCEMWLFGSVSAAYEDFPEVRPTHWMPLPPPPGINPGSATRGDGHGS